MKKINEISIKETVMDNDELDIENISETEEDVDKIYHSDLEIEANKLKRKNTNELFEEEIRKNVFFNNFINQNFNNLDEIPMDLSAKKSKANYYSMAAAAAMAAVAALNAPSHIASSKNDNNSSPSSSSSSSSSCSTCESPSPSSTSTGFSSSFSVSSISPPSPPMSHQSLHQPFLNLPNKSHPLLPFLFSNSFNFNSSFPNGYSLVQQCFHSNNITPPQLQSFKGLNQKSKYNSNKISNSPSSLATKFFLSPEISPKDVDKCKFDVNMMKKYLKEPKDISVIIIHAKVAQKSYGNEKRFFCPPPCVYLKGNIWRTSNTKNVSNVNNNKSYLKSDQNQSQSNVCTFIGISNSERELQPLVFDNKNFAAAKTMFISDSDKRKHFKLVLRAYYKSGLEIGSFFSNNIKVISKPSKKKQSVKNSDLCIASGTRVALFNRLRSQTVSTRYLFCENGIFYASAYQWGSFIIYLIDDYGCENDEFIVKDGYIHYGATVKLVCSISGMALPKLIIRKVDKSQVVLDACDAVSQLHKCAFYIKDSDDMYLCLSQDRIIQFQATICPKEQNRAIINDGACWTIISTDEARYSWYESMGPSSEPITPIPIVHNIKQVNENDNYFLELKGENFNSNLKIWFDDIQCETIFKCSTNIKCLIPSLSNRDGENFENRTKNNNLLKASILLVRHNDGVIYNSGFHYTYNNSNKIEVQKLDERLKETSLVYFPKQSFSN